MEKRLRSTHDTSSFKPVVHTRETPHPHAFPSYNALPEYHYDAVPVVSLEGKLLMSPHDRKEMFLVHGGEIGKVNLER